MMPLLLIVVAVILIVVLIVVNTKAFSARSNEAAATEQSRNEDPAAAQQPAPEPAKETRTAPAATQSAPVQGSDEKLSASQQTTDANNGNVENKMGDQDYRNALQRLKTKPAPPAPEKEVKSLSMKDNDYRNALKSMNKKRDK